MKTFKQLALAFTCMSVMLFAFSSCNEDDKPGDVSVTGVQIDGESALAMLIGDTKQLSATVLPAEATNTNVTWSSSDDKIATVTTAGNVTAVGAGTCTITVTTEDGELTDTCEITVTAPEGKYLSFAPKVDYLKFSLDGATAVGGETGGSESEIVPTFTVSTNLTAWTATVVDSPEWCRVTTDGDKFTIVVDANTSRETEITAVVKLSGEGVEDQVINISQEAFVSIPETTLEVSPEFDTIFVSASGETFYAIFNITPDFTVVTNAAEWDVESSNPEWLTATKSGDTFTLAATANTNIGEGRTATITVTADDKQVVITVNQDQPAIDVYVAGYVIAGGVKKAVYWKNGDMIELTDGTRDAEARSIFIDGDQVYVAGYELSTSGYKTPYYWLNDAAGATALSVADTDRDATASSIVVDNNIVYTAGTILRPQGPYSILEKPTLWTGTDYTVLPGANQGGATSVFVYNGDVYVAGYGVTTTTDLYYWKNGTSTLIVSANYEAVTIGGIYVYEGTPYFAATRKDDGTNALPYYWQGTTGVRLEEPITDGPPQNYTAGSVYVDNGTVYTCASAMGFAATSGGYALGKSAVYWKDMEKVKLSGSVDYTFATDITVQAGSVYVCGYENNIGGDVENACYWENGTMHQLSDGTVKAQATSIFVNIR